MGERELDHYVAFLSSVYTGLADLRREIYRLHQPRRIWIVDDIRKDLSHIRHDSPPDEIRRLSRVCLGAVRKCDMLIWLVLSHDGRTKIAGDERRVSLMEGEVMQAVFQMMPIHLIRVSTAEAPHLELDESLDGFITLLKQSYPIVASDVECERDKVINHVKDILNHASQAKSLGRRALTFRRLARALSTSVLSRRFVPMVAVGRRTTPLNNIESLLDEAEDTRYDYSYRLSLLWATMRNLQSWIDVEVDDDTKAHVDALLERTLRRWQSAAAWYGIHKHFGWGRFEAINELSRKLGQDMAGAEASLHYSLANTGPICGRSNALRRVEAAIKEAKSKVGADLTGLLLIEAHREGRSLFGASRRRKALRLAYRALLTRRRRGEPNHRVGEAQVDVGWFMCLCGRCRQGCLEAREGLSLLEGSRVEPGFVVQKRRVLGLCYFVALRIPEAVKEWAAAYRAAIEHCALDQIRWYTRLAHRLSRERRVRQG